MKRAEEWDWPPTRRWKFQYRRTFDAQPSGWNSPGATKAVRIYWRVTITIIKMLIAIPLAIMAIGAFWLLGVIIWTLITP